jgi:hypothetical protein
MKRLISALGLAAILAGWAGAGHALVINEINADPAADANGDGTVDAGDDEFVELANEGPDDIDLSGWTLSDAISVRHVFPAGSIVPAGGCLLVFGGGVVDPSGTPAATFGGAVIQNASSGSLSLNNTGDTVIVAEGAGYVVSYAYGPEAGDNQSITLDPDITGTPPLIPHSTAVGSAGTISPGLTVSWGMFPGASFLCFLDLDGDGYGDAGDSLTAELPPVGYVKNDADCNDADADIYPGATELVDGQDNDCDGQLIADEIDGDDDGYVPGTIDVGGWDGVGTVVGGDDCDDDNPDVHPWAEEICDGLDNDCDDEIDEGCLPFAIQSVRDVGNDQGRQVRLRWWRIGDDAPSVGADITSYNVFRRIDGNRHTPGGAKMPPGDWDFLGEVPASGEEVYNLVVPTLCDSTSSGICWSVFFVRARTADPYVYTDTPPDSGYSIDNIVPPPPTGLTVVYGEINVLAWEDNPAPDFAWFDIHRGATPDFVPTATSLVHQTQQLSWVDPEGTWNDYYKLVAVDDAGNQSDPASPQVLSGADHPAIPAVTALLGNVPNPFNPATTILYSLAKPQIVTLKIFDMTGRQVRELLSREARAAGRQEVIWYGRDDEGDAVASGVYFYRLEAGDYVETRRMTLLK